MNDLEITEKIEGDCKCLLCGEEAFRFNFTIGREIHLVSKHDYLTTSSKVKEESNKTMKQIMVGFDKVK
jgi:hypothetical protein